MDREEKNDTEKTEPEKEKEPGEKTASAPPPARWPHRSQSSGTVRETVRNYPSDG